MRDIRGDLQDRASLLEGQISAHEAQFEKLVAQIRAEHEARLKDLRAEFDVVTKLHELEQRRLDNAPQAPTGAPVQSAPTPYLSHPFRACTNRQRLKRIRAFISPPNSLHRHPSRRSRLTISWSAS